MEGQRIETLELLRKIQRSAGDQRKIFLALYGILLFVPLCLLVVAAGRSALGGALGGEVEAVFLRPVAATLGFFSAAFEAGRIPRKRHASASSPMEGLIGTAPS